MSRPDIEAIRERCEIAKGRTNSLLVATAYGIDVPDLLAHIDALETQRDVLDRLVRRREWRSWMEEIDGIDMEQRTPADLPDDERQELQRVLRRGT